MPAYTSNESTGKPDVLMDACLGRPVVDWNPNVMAVVAHRIEDAMELQSNSELVKVSGQLEQLMRQVLAEAPVEVVQAVQGGHSDLRAAYMLGCLSFAQQFVASVAHRRPNDEFYKAFQNERFVKVLALLAESDRTKPELSACTPLAMTTVQVVMKELVGLGIVDFKMRYSVVDGKEQGDAEYFLTPAARQMMNP